MGLMRAIGRVGMLAAAGAAAGVYLRRKGLLGGPAPALGPPPPEPPSEPLFVPQPEAAPVEEEPEPEPVEAEPEPVEAEPEPVDAEPEPVEEEPEQVDAEPEPVEEEPEQVDAEPEPVEEEPEPVEGVLEEPEPEPETEAIDAVTEEAEVVAVEVEPEPEVEEERPDVTAVVDDLLAVGKEGAMADADVVPASEDARVAEAVRVALAEEPGLLSAPIDIEVEGGRVRLHGELERPSAIAAVEAKTKAVDGVLAVESLLHLPGTPRPEQA